jgi:hypothetical protein
MHREATRLYDLLLTTGVGPGDAQAKVAELYSPPRVTVELGRLPHLSLKGGSTFDLRADANGRSWDFRLLEHRRRAHAQVAREKPYLVMGSPPCTEFSALQNLCRGRRSAAERQRRLVEARVLLAFGGVVYELKTGRRPTLPARAPCHGNELEGARC